MLDVFDHVGLRVSDLEASRRCYELALAELGYGEPYRGPDFFEWEDLAIGQARDDRPATRNLHLALVASSREQVDAWWRAMTAAGHPDDGAPGPRPQYSPTYYGAFVRDPDGNSLEAVHHGEPREGENRLDHLWIRVRDLAESRLFYETVAPTVGLRVHDGDERRFHVTSGGRSFALVQDEAGDRERAPRVPGVRPRDRRGVPSRRARGRLPRQRRSGRARRSTTPATTARSCSTLTATTSKRSSTTAPPPRRAYLRTVSQTIVRIRSRRPTARTGR